MQKANFSRFFGYFNFWSICKWSVIMKLEPEMITVRTSINMSTVYKNNSKVGEKMYRSTWNLDTQNVILILLLLLDFENLLAYQTWSLCAVRIVMSDFASNKPPVPVFFVSWLMSLSEISIMCITIEIVDGVLLWAQIPVTICIANSFDSVQSVLSAVHRYTLCQGLSDIKVN